MPLETRDVCRIQPRCRALSETSLGGTMEAAATDLSSSEVPTMMMSLTDLLMLNAIVCGLEFCASAAFCYIPPLLLKAGIRYSYCSNTSVYTVLAELMVRQSFTIVHCEKVIYAVAFLFICSSITFVKFMTGLDHRTVFTVMVLPVLYWCVNRYSEFLTGHFVRF